MRVWLPGVRAGTGTDIYTERLAEALREAGVHAEVQFFPHRLQYIPWALNAVPAPPRTDMVVTNSWNGFAFARPSVKLVVVNHLCVFDDALAPYKSKAQALFHARLLHRFESWSYAKADAVVAVSGYTARQVEKAFPGTRVRVLYNGVDTSRFSPGSGPEEKRRDGLDLLFVGNLSRRKGADLLPQIMSRLGPNHRLYYTSGLRSNDRLPEAPNLRPLGTLDQSRMLDAYRRSDLVLFPTRLEGFGYAAVEAMACGKPVVASAVSSLPEIIESGRTGLLCPADDVDCFAAAIEGLYQDPERRRAMGAAARKTAVERFSAAAMVQGYIGLFDELLNRPL